MTARSLLALLGWSCCTLVPAQGLGPIGSWQDHFSYRQARSVELGGGMVYCATSNAAFRYDPSSGEIERITKVNGLSDIGINGLAWNAERAALLVYYDNGNLDLVYSGGASYNMSDIKRANIQGNKSVNTVLMDGPMAYLGCGFGVVVVDLAQREVRDTWFLGPNGTHVNVSGIAIHNDSIHVATTGGLFRAYRYASNLASFTNWQKRTDLPAHMVNGPFNALAAFDGRLVANYASAGGADTLLLIDGAGVHRFEPLYGARVRALKVSADGQYMSVTLNNAIRVYGADMAEVMMNDWYAGTWTDALQAVYGNGVIWVADRRIGLVRATGGGAGYTIAPPGPENSSVYRLAAEQGVLFAATGAVSGTWTNTYHKAGVHHYADGYWVTNHLENTPLMVGANDFAGAANDIMAVAVDPNDPGRAFAGSWDDGLLEFRDRAPLKWWNNSNSTLQQEINGPAGKVNIGGLSFDSEGNLWMTNALAPAVLAVYTRNGEWRSFTPGALLNSNYLVADVMATTIGQKWVVRPRGNGLLVMYDGGTVLDTGDDRYRLITNVPGNGGLPTNDVRAVAEDLNGHIWVGTAQGPVVFYDAAGLFGNSPQDAQQILLEQDGNVQILLETEVVTAIAVDGANRKWIGTETSGVFLIDHDGRTQVAHYTAENSPLPSNMVHSIAWDGATGEVYFATSAGIVSYRSSATEGSLTSECAKVFPNPVHESYTGPVAISGLMFDSEVKITDVAGNLVYRTTSLGGQAIWPGTDMSGNRVATGVYLILATDRYGSSKCNTKVLVVR